MESNAELYAAILTTVSMVAVFLLNRYGHGKAAKIVEAVSPHIVATMNKVLADGQITKADAKVVAMEAARYVVKDLSPVLSKSMLETSVNAIASEAIERAVSAAKVGVGKEVVVGAFTNGKNLGAEIAAKFKRGEIGANVTAGAGKVAAGITGKFRF